MRGSEPLQIVPIQGIGEVSRGDDLGELVLRHGDIRPGDVLVVTSKAVAKAEDRLVAAPVDDAERESLIARESVRVVRRRGSLLITETKHGFVCANAGVDWSNVESGKVVLLPVDPDGSAQVIREHLHLELGFDVPVIVSDTFGRPWRNGVTDVAIGCAGIQPVLDLRGTLDALGNVLGATQVCIADEIAAAADLVMGKSSGVPAAIVRGLSEEVFGDGGAVREIIRQPEDDLFR